jgi:hypothetical protein
MCSHLLLTKCTRYITDYGYCEDSFERVELGLENLCGFARILVTCDPMCVYSSIFMVLVLCGLLDIGGWR